MPSNVKKFRSPKTCLEEAVEFEKEVGFEAVIVVGIPKDTPDEFYIGMTKGLPKSYAVYLLECAKQAFVVPVVLTALSPKEDEEGF